MADCAVLEKVKEQLRAGHKIPSLGRVFNTYDSAGARRVDAQEFFEGINNSGVCLSKEETDCMLACLDTNGDGNVNYDNFLTSIRGCLNKERQDVVMAAFAKFDLEGCNVVKASDLRAAACVSSHPRVISGDITEDEAFLEFLANFGDRNNDGCITLTEWCDYYSAISAEIQSDDHFCKLVKTYWNL